MSYAIQYATKELIPSFYDCLAVVAREHNYIEMVEPPPYEGVEKFQSGIIDLKEPVFYAVESNVVVGWCDIRSIDNPRLKHRAVLGTGLLPAYRGKGIGSALMKASLDYTKSHTAIEKVELTVYTTNSAAIALYRKFGFQEEGLIKNYRKFGGRYYDAIAMAKFVRP